MSYSSHGALTTPKEAGLFKNLNSSCRFCFIYFKISEGLNKFKISLIISERANDNDEFNVEIHAVRKENTSLSQELLLQYTQCRVCNQIL